MTPRSRWRASWAYRLTRATGPSSASRQIELELAQLLQAAGDLVAGLERDALNEGLASIRGTKSSHERTTALRISTEFWAFGWHGCTSTPRARRTTRSRPKSR